MNKILLFLILLGLWLLISGFFKPLFIFYGISSCLISIFFFNKMLNLTKVKSTGNRYKFLSFGFIKYVLWLGKEIVLSSFNVAIEMWREKPNIKPETKWIKHNLKLDTNRAVYANSITLTPGTVSMYVTEKEMLVHALHENGIADLEKNKMHDKIKNSLDG